MKCDKLMQDALNLHIDPEARVALNTVPKDETIVDNKLQEVSSGMQKQEEES